MSWESVFERDVLSDGTPGPIPLNRHSFAPQNVEFARLEATVFTDAFCASLSGLRQGARRR